MMLKKWDNLPDFMQVKEIKPYYDILRRHRGSLIIKRVFDIIAGSILIAILAVPMCIIAVMIKKDSSGPVFYRQERVTVYGKKFRIHKFRTMVDGADRKGSTVTVDNDNRITKIGATLRDRRLDELPQLFDVLDGNMSFVGTRPEAVKYVEQYGKYDKAYYATLLMPAGITSETSIRYKDEAQLLEEADDVDLVYMRDILPGKMKWNLDSIKNFSLINDIKTMFRTVGAVRKR